MRAMVLESQRRKLILKEITLLSLSHRQICIRINACGICRTDLHVVDGDLKHPKIPLIPGHQIIGVIEQIGYGVEKFKIGDRVGVPWLGGSCGRCEFCLREQENLCDEAKYTGYQLDGGFAEYGVADSRFCFPVPAGFSDLQAAPLMCAGLIGYRALKKIPEAKHIGFYGFGSSAHILTQLAVYEDRKIYAFTKEGDKKTQQFAKELGAVWAGDPTQLPVNTQLDAAIIFAPIGRLVPTALRQIKKGGTVVCAGIHMSDIPSFPYEILWGERKIVSVANLTRKDGEEFLKIAPKVPIRTQIHVYPLEKVNEALEDLRKGRFEGSAVIQMWQD